MKFWTWLWGCPHTVTYYRFTATSDTGLVDVYECEECRDRIYRQRTPGY